MAVDLTNYLLGLVYIEQPFGGSCTLICHHDGFPVGLGDLDLLKGQEVTLGLGHVTVDGNEYSDVAPLWVKSSRLISAQGELIIELSCFDIWQRLGMTEAMGSSVAAAPSWSGDTTILAIIEALLSGITTVTLDSSDGIVDSYKPYYTTAVDDKIGQLIVELLALTNCGIKMRQDGIHIFSIPALADTFEYTYELDGDHVFFSNVWDESLPLPNRIIVVDVLPDEAATYHTYEGIATDEDSYTKLGYYVTRIYAVSSITSNALATQFAQSILSQYQKDVVTGILITPHNCGQELYDRVQVIDSRSGQTWKGYVGTLRHIYDTTAGVYNLEIGLGGIGRGMPVWADGENPEEESDLVAHRGSVITAYTTELIPGTPYPTSGRVSTLWEYTPAEYESWYRQEEYAYSMNRAAIAIVKPGTDEFFTAGEYYNRLGLTMLERALIARPLADIESYLKYYDIAPTAGLYQHFAMKGSSYDYWKEQARAFLLGSGGQSYSANTRQLHRYRKPRYPWARTPVARSIGPNEIRATQIDWGTGSGQVSAVDVPIADAGSYYTAAEVEAALQEVGVGAFSGGLYGLNVETLTGDKTLTVGTDKICQYLNPGAANRIVTLATAGAVAGDRFVIRHDGIASCAFYLRIKQGTSTLDYAYVWAIKEFIFDGTNWIALGYGTGFADLRDAIVAIGHSANAYTEGVAIGEGALGYLCGVGIGWNGWGYNEGVGIGCPGVGYDQSVGIGFYADALTYSIALGYYCNAWNYAISIGAKATNNGKYYSQALGYYSETERTAETSVNIDGDTGQKNNVVQGRWSKDTADATPIEMFCGAIANQRFTVRVQSALAFKMTVVARDDTAGHVAMYLFEGLIKRDASNNTALSVCNKTIIHEDDSSWDAAVTADDTNEALIITVTGDGTNATQFAAVMDGVETHF